MKREPQVMLSSERNQEGIQNFYGENSRIIFFS